MKTSTLVPPAAPPLSLADGRAFLRVDYDNDDLLIAELIHAATARIEITAALRLMPQTVQFDLQDWPEDALNKGCLRLPLRPVRAITAITADGADVSDGFDLVPQTWPAVFPLEHWPDAGSGISITAEVGFASIDDIPDDLMLALKLILAQSYRARDGGANETLARDISALLSPWRRAML